VAHVCSGQNVSTSVVLIPKTAGKFTTAPAQFSYESDSERKVSTRWCNLPATLQVVIGRVSLLFQEGFSSSFGEVYVLTPEEHERVSATYVVCAQRGTVLSASTQLVTCHVLQKEWVIFAVLSLLPLAAPFGVWNQHKKARLASLNKAK
jgi:Translocon-associated protein beta (TRAPB)